MPGTPPRALCPDGPWSRLWAVSLLVVILCGLAGLTPFGVASAQAAERDDLVGRVVREIQVEGVRRVDEGTVKLVLSSRPGRPLSLTNAAEDLRAVYGMTFFSTVEVFARLVEGGKDAGKVDLVIRVKEKPAVRQVVIQGNDALSDEDLKEAVDIRPFTILDEARARRNRQKIADLYSEKGYYLAEVVQTLVPVGEDQIDIVFTVVENAKVEVRSVDFVGNQNIDDATLEDSIQTREGNLISFLTQAGTYRKDAFEIDILRISNEYFNRGFINVKVDTPDVEISADRKYVYITIRIEEGEQYSVGDLAFSGDVLDSEKDLLNRVQTKSGEVFNRQKLSQDLEAIRARYQNDGYAYANVTPLNRVDQDERIVHLTFDVQKGSKVYYERIEIVGNTKTRDQVVRRELRIYEGELSSALAREVSQRRVMALGYFESVDITTKRGSADDLQIVEVAIKEKATGSFQVGAGFSSVESFIATAQIRQDNFLGRGQALQLSAQISSLRQLFQVRFTEPYLLDSLWTLTLNGFNTETQYRSFYRTATGGDITVGYPITDDVRVFGTYSLEFVRSRGSDGSIPQPAYFPLNNSGRISSLRGTVTYDTRDNRLFPGSGMYHSLSAEVSESWLGASDNRTFQRYRGFLRFYKKLFFDTVGKVSIRAGYLNSTATQALSPTEKFVLGGINSLRGYQAFTIGPERRAATNIRGNERLDPFAGTQVFVEGGNKEFLLNAELEIPLLLEVGIRGVIFLDAGNVYAEEENFFYAGGDVRGSGCLDSETILYPDGTERLCRNFGWNPRSLPLGLLWSVGFGFRWFSPIGPLRFEWGIPLTRRPSDSAGPLFEFSIGNSF